VAITTSTDEAAEDGEKRVSASFDEGTEQVLTVGDEEVAADHLGAAEKAMIDGLEEDVKQLTVAEGQVVGIADEVDPVEGQDSVVGEESRWRHRLVLYDNDKELYDGAKAEGFTGKWTDELFRQLGAYAIGVLQGHVGQRRDLRVGRRDRPAGEGDAAPARHAGDGSRASARRWRST